MINGSRYIFTFGLISLFAGACNSGGDFRGAIGATHDDKDTEKDAEDEEDADANEPAQVTGAFLTCAFMESETEVIDKAKSDPQGNVDVACGLFKKTGNSFGRIEDANLEMQARILTNEGKLLHVEKTTRLQGGSQLQFVIPVPIQHLSGTIHVDYFERATKLYSSRRKSIPTITEFLAKYSYNVEDDESVTRFVNGELELGRIDPNDSQPPEKKVEWWQVVVPVVVAVFGPQAQEPASFDNGATVYKPCKCKNKPKNPGQISAGGGANMPSQNDSMTNQTPTNKQPVQQKPVEEEYVPVDVIVKKPKEPLSQPPPEPKPAETVPAPSDADPKEPQLESPVTQGDSSQSGTSTPAAGGDDAKP